MVMREKGEHLGIYHVGTTEEVAIADLARRMAAIAGREIVLAPSAVLAGSTPRRCPDISKLAALGYRPRVPLDDGLPPTLDWYWDHESEAPRGADGSEKEMALFPEKVARAAGTGASVPVECCQVCGHAPLDNVLSLGYMPPVNQMVPIGQVPRQQPWFPTDLLHCGKCDLVQLGLAVDPVIIFPPEYPYTSGTTKLLRDNFAELCPEASAMLKLGPQDLVVDIGSNDGTLLSNFQNGGHRVLGIEPTEVGKIASSRGIPTLMRYFTPAMAAEVKREHGPARVVTAANCFAHIEDVHAIVEGISICWRPTACSSPNRTISSGCSTRCNTTPSITSICATIRVAASPSAADARARSLSRPADPDAWRLDPRLCRAARRAAGERQRRANAGGRAARRRDAGAARTPSATT